MINILKDMILTFLTGSFVGMVTFFVLTLIKGDDALYFIPAPPTWAGIAGIVGIFVGALILKKLLGV